MSAAGVTIPTFRHLLCSLDSPLNGAYPAISGSQLSQTDVSESSFPSACRKERGRSLGAR